MLCPVSFIVEDEGSDFFTRTFRQPIVSTRESQFLRENIFSALRPAFPLIMDAMQYSFSIYLLNIAFSKAGNNPNTFTYNTGRPISRQWQTGCKHATSTMNIGCVLDFLSLRSSAGHVQVYTPIQDSSWFDTLETAPFNYHHFACQHPFWPANQTPVQIGD